MKVMTQSQARAESIRVWKKFHGRPKPPKFHIHHIVALTHRNPWNRKSQQIVWSKLGRDGLWHIANLVAVPEAYHRRMHTKHYFKEVYNTLRGSKNRPDVIRRLNIMKTALLIDSLSPTHRFHK